ncbi:hypothetical protein AO372_0717 [Moraxella catarrhalis]|nr:hypothetical protein AO372_0717 [Moraxella catarrhalis]
MSRLFWLVFLSDLCGREEKAKAHAEYITFPSDPCGREEKLLDDADSMGVSKRPVRS